MRAIAARFTDESVKLDTEKRKVLTTVKMIVGNVMKGKLVMLFRRFVLFARNVGRNRENDNKDKLRPKFEWPHVMSSSVAMGGPLVSGTWIWHHQHARWHHGYYRTRR